MTQPLTLTLILMRHAKSSWDDPGQSDHARSLNDRGVRSAAALGDWLRSSGHVPDQILCSSSQRTRETCAGLRLDGVPVMFLDGLYHAGPDRMAAILAQATGRVVLMIGHNPGIAELAELMVQKPPAHPRFFDYPTGASLVLEFDADTWAAAKFGAGRCVEFVIPHDLPGA